MILISIFLIITFLLCIIIFVLVTKRKINAKKEIVNELSSYGNLTTGKKIYDYKIETNDLTYFIKVIYNFNNLEISINNKNYWILNDKEVSNKKGGTKLEGIYDLVNSTNLTNDNHKKVYLVYPSSKVLVKAVNESELAFINPKTDCYGVNIVKFEEISEIFKK